MRFLLPDHLTSIFDDSTALHQRCHCMFCCVEKFLNCCVVRHTYYIPRIVSAMISTLFVICSWIYPYPVYQVHSYHISIFLSTPFQFQACIFPLILFILRCLNCQFLSSPLTIEQLRSPLLEIISYQITIWRFILATHYLFLSLCLVETSLLWGTSCAIWCIDWCYQI